MSRDSRSSLLRIIDANLNRAAEALRAAEEVCRFHWNLPGFARDLKMLRHAVLGSVSSGGLQREEILLHRDVEGDVGRDSDSPGTGADAPAMAYRNLERAKEALRALEEACRIAAPGAAPALEEARYRLYSIEKGIGIAFRSPAGELRARLADVQLCLLATSSPARRPLLRVVSEAIDGGAGMVQLREKDLSGRELLRLARELRELTARRGAIFIVNDRPDVAALSHSDGVHLGQADIPVAEARRLLGPDRLIGVSTHSADQARAAEREGADYIGAGPMFPSATKDAGPILGPEGLTRVLAAVALPAFAIGGIGEENVARVAGAGGRRIAVSSAILDAAKPAQTAAALLRGLGGLPGASTAPPR